LIGVQKSVMTAGAMLMHGVDQAAYHRGLVMRMFAEVPARPPLTELPVFLGESGE
jgi:uncharacterized damage-inducible protein DinB